MLLVWSELCFARMADIKLSCFVLSFKLSTMIYNLEKLKVKKETKCLLNDREEVIID